MNSGAERKDRDLAGFAFRAAVAVGVTVAIVTVMALLALAVNVLVLGFAGILVAVLVRGLSDWLAGHTGLREGYAVALVIFFLLLITGGVLWFSASGIIQQFDTMAKMLPLAVEAIQQQLRNYEWGRQLLEQASSIDWLSRRINIVGRMTGAVSTAFGLVLSLVVVVFLGLYLAAQPDIYINGAIRLVPIKARPRTRAVLEAIGRTLRKWMVGTLMSMTIVGILSGVGLWLLQVPFPLALGLLAAILTFIPYLGAIASSIPAMLVAMTHGPQYALYVAALYLGIHLVEGYLLNPMIQQYVVSLPAGLLLFAQITLGILLGGLGVVLAAPITATLVVVIRMLYVEDLLGDSG